METKKLSNSMIEMISTGAIERLCMETERIKTNIIKNNTTPSWDGELFFYKTGAALNDFKKDDLIKKIQIQIKGTQVEHFSENTLKFKMDVSDLRNYYKNEGTLVFVVEIINKNNYKVFYNDLLHSKLKSILDEIDEENKNRKENDKYNGKEQHGKRIKFERLKENSDFLVLLLEYYVTNSNMQSYSLMNFDCKGNNVYSELLISPRPIIKDGKFKPIPSYLYFKDKLINSEQEIIIPIPGEHYIDEMDIEQNENVAIDNKVFYTTYRINYSVDATRYYLNKYMFFYEEDEKLYILSPSGTVDDYLKNLKFQVQLVEHQNVKLGNNIIKRFNIQNKEVLKQIILEEIQQYEKFKELLSFINLNQKDFLLEDILEDQNFSIGYLIASFVTKEAIPRESLPEFQLIKIKIGKYDLLFEEHFNEENSYLVDILGNPNENKKYICDVSYSPYLLLPLEYMGYFNYDLNKALVSIKDSKNLTQDYISTVLNYINRLIKYYDLKQEQTYIDAALDLIEWLLNYIEGHPLLVIKYMIIKRIRNLTQKEILEIYKLKNIENVRWFHFMIDVLVDDLEEQKELIKNFSDEDIFMLNTNNVEGLTMLRWRTIDMESFVREKRSLL